MQPARSLTHEFSGKPGKPAAARREARPQPRARGTDALGAHCEGIACGTVSGLAALTLSRTARLSIVPQYSRRRHPTAQKAAQLASCAPRPRQKRWMKRTIFLTRSDWNRRGV